ncbi:Flp pilus assembly protein TadG [Rhizobiales bacterium GAS191]|jgi:Flp pilus assembly protein TadG|nr:Flp pilus assembly protein TadG [Rhizobiales bacterium GAS113]SEC61219.1 Flp pilus assembly protein TadG [Rhizobiales bacterium GAS188]SEC67383.1 Flp pilus assembly protein TadG [Rhizobiales bacterium GAS191]
MRQPFSWLLRSVRRFYRNRAGNIAMMTAFAIVPLVSAVGVTIDYSRFVNARTKADGAADAATLQALSKNAQPFVNTPTQSQVAQFFNTMTSTIPGLTITSTNVSVTPSVTNMAVTLTYSGTVQTAFGGILGVNSVAIGGTSTAQVNAPPYVNFYLLLDNSPSMGLGATDADINNLITLTANQTSTVSPNVKSGSIPRANCAFACHQHTFDSSGNITGDDLNDNYHIAKKNGVTLRIDVLRTATQQLTQTATANTIQPNQFSMGVYTFSDTFQTVAPLSSNMPTVASNAAAIDLAYAYWDARDAQTSFDTALTYMNGIMPNPGSGTSAAFPQEFVFLVTDGVEDEPVSGASGSGDPADKPTHYLPLNNQPNLANSQTGNVNSKRLIDMIKSSPGGVCDTIKSRGIKIAVLYTPYLPVTSNAFYNKWIGPYNSSPVNPNNISDPANNEIGKALRACASPGFYFQVTPTQGISQAMQQMFVAAIQWVQLTN